MVDPITAFAAVQSAVKMIKKASAAVDDVASLGPLIGKYFDAKHAATKAAREAKKQGGSNMGKAIEIELALKSQRDFEEQLKGLFFSSNNMDIWNNIQRRVAEMDQEDRLEADRERTRIRNAKRRQQEINEYLLAFAIVTVVGIVVLWGVMEVAEYCKGAKCGR
jgi:alkyl sulfatase BDS1-like metallo-beta-lactamase superfamily hydrolase